MRPEVKGGNGGWVERVATGRAINGGRGLSRNGIKRFTTGPQISTDAMDECKGGSCYCTPSPIPTMCTPFPRYAISDAPTLSSVRRSRVSALPFHSNSERVRDRGIILSRRGPMNTFEDALGPFHFGGC